MSKEAILKKVLGAYESTGSEMLFHCPSCGHHKQKLSVNIEKDAWKCWVCEYSGVKLGKLIKKWGGTYNSFEWENESRPGVPTTEELSNRTKQLLEAFEDDIRVTSEPMDLPKEFRSLSNPKYPEEFEAIKYLASRGMTQRDIIRWKIGYCASGEFENRIVVPSFNVFGDCDYFVGRTVKWGYKYQNPICEKTNIIFNELFIDWEQDVVIVEGVFDAIKAENAIPILGSYLKKDSRLFKQLVKYKPDVYMALDGDVFLKEEKILELLISYGVDVFKIETGDIEDIGSITKEEFTKRKQKAKRADWSFLMKSRIERFIA